MNSSEFQDIAP